MEDGGLLGLVGCLWSAPGACWVPVEGVGLLVGSLWRGWGCSSCLLGPLALAHYAFLTFNQNVLQNKLCVHTSISNLG